MTAFIPASWAKDPAKIWEEFERVYVHADYHRALDTAHEKLDPAKLKGFVVLMKDGIPAERAAFYIGWGDYDYRGVTIDGEKVTTRRGKPYALLQAGDVLAISDTDHLGRSLYLKLITPEVYIPADKADKKHQSCVTNDIIFKLPKDVYKEDNAEKAMELLGEWFKPFTNIDDAKNFASTLAKKD